MLTRAEFPLKSIEFCLSYNCKVCSKLISYVENVACCKLGLARELDAGHTHTGQLTMIFLCARMLVMTFFQAAFH